MTSSILSDVMARGICERMLTTAGTSFISLFVTSVILVSLLSTR